MKKLFSLILTAAMLLGTLALAACETPPEQNPDQPTYANEVELMLLGSQKTAEAFAKNDAFSAFLETIKNPKIGLTADLKDLAGVSLDASMLRGDDFYGLLLNKLSFPSGKDDYIPALGTGSFVTLSDIAMYIAKEEVALSVPMLFGEGYYGIKYENLLTFLESLLGDIPNDERPEAEAAFNKVFDAIGSVFNTADNNPLSAPALPQGFTAFLSDLMKEKMSLAKTESNGNTILSFDLTAGGLVAVLEGALTELRKDTAWKSYFDSLDITFKIANEAVTLDAFIDYLKEAAQNAIRSYVVSTVYDSQYRIVESNISLNGEGSPTESLKMIASYGEFSKLTLSYSAHDELFDGATYSTNFAIAYEEKKFDENKNGFFLKMSIPTNPFGGTAAPDHGIVGGADILPTASISNNEDNIVIELDYYLDSANDDFKLSLAVKQGPVKMFDAALLGKLKLENNVLTFSVTKLEIQYPEQPGVTVSLNMNISIKIAEMTAEDKVLPAYKDFTTLPPEILDAIKGLLGGGSIG